MGADIFMKSTGWLDYCQNPSSPRMRVPAGAVDAHCHVFGPGNTFPYALERKYTPGDAPKEALFALRDHLGFERNVIVQATCHGTDNRAMLDALQDAGDRARGVAVVDTRVSDQELAAMYDAGVRAVRINFVPRLVARPPDLAEVSQLTHRLATHGMHVVVYFEAEQLPKLYEFLAGLPTTVVIDHLGRMDTSQGLVSEAFELLVRLMRENDHIWCKVSCPERLSQTGPAAVDLQPPFYTDVVPFARRIIELFPERVLWGTDWPHPNLKNHMPDDGLLVDYIKQIAATVALQRRLLVDNPMWLYWGEPVRP